MENQTEQPKKKLSTGKKVLIGVGVLVLLIGITQSGKNAKAENNQKDASIIETSSKKPEIEILQDKASTNDIGIMTVHVVVKNNSDELKHYVQIDASFFDKDGGIVGTGIGNTSNLAPHAERTIDVLAMDIHNAATYKLDVKDGF